MTRDEIIAEVEACLNVRRPLRGETKYAVLALPLLSGEDPVMGAAVLSTVSGEFALTEEQGNAIIALLRS